MFIASIAYFFIFSYKPFAHSPPDGEVPFITAFIKAFSESDEEEVITDSQPLCSDSITNSDYYLYGTEEPVLKSVKVVNCNPDHNSDDVNGNDNLN